jgi:hypothetical protein
MRSSIVGWRARYHPQGRLALGRGDAAGCRRILRNRCGEPRPGGFHRAVLGGGLAQPADQILIVTELLGLGALEPVEQHLYPVDGRQDERDGIAGDRCTVAKISHQGFGRMGEGFEPWQAEKAAGPLDGVDEP